METKGRAAMVWATLSYGLRVVTKVTEGGEELLEQWAAGRVRFRSRPREKG